MTASASDHARASSAEKPLRLFVALPLPDEIVNQVAALGAKLRKGIEFTGSKLRWGQPETMHLTLAFLGDTPASKVEAVGDAVRGAAIDFPPQRLEIRQLGVFPHWKRPRVIWVGIRDRSKLLSALHTALHQRLAPLGYEPENKEFRPHITLARFKDYQHLAAIEKIAHDHSSFCFGPFLCDHIVLFRSELGSAGPTHSRVITEKLCAPNPASEIVTS